VEGQKLRLKSLGRNSDLVSSAIPRLNQTYSAPRTDPRPAQSPPHPPFCLWQPRHWLSRLPLQTANSPTHRPDLPRSLSACLSSARGSPGEERAVQI
jgi:hypothetical protein